MRKQASESSIARRSFLGRLGTGLGLLGVAAVNAPAAAAQAAAETPWKAARHSQDDWLDHIPGEHRLVMDTTTYEGIAIGLRMVGNYFNTNEKAYGLKDNDLAVVIVVRYRSTAFAYNDAIWAKYGKMLSEQTGFTDPKTHAPPTTNVLAHETEVGLDGLIQKGAQFAVCLSATTNIAGRIAHATGGKTEDIIHEIGANLVPNARLVPAGIVAVNRAQEHGYSLVVAI